jgi:DNA-directed RNA polymerase subunit H|tara:strand:+ start:139 stop:369 length:231 start_codon:yes stop_codon:yes gene_type:complete
MADTTHVLVPKHSLLTDAQKEAFLASHNLTFKEVPKILVDDPALATLQAKAGDIVKIERKSATAGISDYYRGVING